MIASFRLWLALLICPYLLDELGALRSGNTKLVLENQQLLDLLASGASNADTSTSRGIISSLSAQELREIIAMDPGPTREVGNVSSAGVDDLRKRAFDLSCHDQYRLAFFIAENVGYVLVEETAHPDSPHAPDQVPSTDCALPHGFRRCPVDDRACDCMRPCDAPSKGFVTSTSQTPTPWGQIAAIYSELDAEDCKVLDREWARMRGYILPTDGTNAVSQTSPIMQAAESAQKVVDGWSDSKREYADRVTGPQSQTSRA